MLDLLTLLSVGAPRGNGAVNAIAQAADGNDGPLKALQAGVGRVMDGYTADRLSQGLHASTLCADAPAPWGDAAAPLEGREQALEDAATQLGEDDLYPYDRETATGNGIALQCLYWPPVDVPRGAGPGARCPTSRPSLLAGDKDLSTPLEWAQRDRQARAAAAELIIVEGAGHGVQNQGDAEGARGGAAPSIAGVIDELIRTRRTHKAFGPDPVPHAVLLELFELARWAPNHHVTDPWRFRVLGAQRQGAAQGRRRGVQARLGREARPRAHADRGQRQADRRRRPGPRGRAGDRGRVLHRAARRARARAGRLLAHDPGPGHARPAARPRACPDDELPIGLLHLGDPRQEQRVPERAPVEEIAIFLD